MDEVGNFRVGNAFLMGTPWPSEDDHRKREGTMTIRSSYVINGGRPGRDRLRVLSSALQPSTRAILERAGVRDASRILDLGCGGGDVTLTIAEMAPDAHITGVDFDPVIVQLATSEARQRGVTNVRYEVGDVSEVDLDADSYDVVYARFLLSHVGRPDLCLARMASWTRPGGTLVVEDVDIPAAVCSPELAAFTRINTLMSTAMRRRGGDPELGQRLPVLLHEAGLDDLETHVVQPGGLQGDAKLIQLLTLVNITDTLTDLELATRDEIERLSAELASYVNRTDTYATTARVFQCFGRRPDHPPVLRTRGCMMHDQDNAQLTRT